MSSKYKIYNFKKFHYIPQSQKKKNIVAFMAIYILHPTSWDTKSTQWSTDSEEDLPLCTEKLRKNVQNQSRLLGDEKWMSSSHVGGQESVKKGYKRGEICWRHGGIDRL